ncbi:hypothetical protein PsYK624_061310 [Phanerochaete sordida]|uniref:Uncharacterized protein n=1 Tax=Phanerochaete sordida TaxID=48140 RepID=A0A9P3LC93_9APHY|nr:hypothetical protein PsYK624_061310 [Phanerochaete sordida]
MKVHFCDQAKEQLKAIDEQFPELEGKAAEIHEEYVREYTEQHCPDARRANVRKISHESGTSQEEPEHATVSFKGPRSVDPKGRHVYMDFWARFLGSKKD